jgi:hypothetical protein
MSRPNNPRHSDGWKTGYKFLRVPLPFIEYWMCALTGSQIKVWLYVFRHSAGYKRHRVTLTYEQIAHGKKRKDGKSADHGTGLSVAGARLVVSELKKRNLLIVESGRNDANTYHCNWALPASVVAPEKGCACYPTSTPDDSVVAGSEPEDSAEELAKCAGGKVISSPRRKARIVPIDTFTDTPA